MELWETDKILWLLQSISFMLQLQGEVGSYSYMAEVEVEEETEWEQNSWTLSKVNKNSHKSRIETNSILEFYFTLY